MFGGYRDTMLVASVLCDNTPRFTPRANGTGLYCAPGAENAPHPIASLCEGVGDIASAAGTGHERRRPYCGGYLASPPGATSKLTRQRADAKSHKRRRIGTRSKKRARLASRRKKPKMRRRYFRQKPGGGRNLGF